PHPADLVPPAASPHGRDHGVPGGGHRAVLAAGRPAAAQRGAELGPAGNHLERARAPQAELWVLRDRPPAGDPRPRAVAGPHPDDPATRGPPGPPVRGRARRNGALPDLYPDRRGGQSPGRIGGDSLPGLYRAFHPLLLGAFHRRLQRPRPPRAASQADRPPGAAVRPGALLRRGARRGAADRSRRLPLPAPRAPAGGDLLRPSSAAPRLRRRGGPRGAALPQDPPRLHRPPLLPRAVRRPPDPDAAGGAH